MAGVPKSVVALPGSAAAASSQGQVVGWQRTQPLRPHVPPSLAGAGRAALSPFTGLRLPTGLAACGLAAAAACGLAVRRRRAGRGRRAYRDGSESRTLKPVKEPLTPQNLYELFSLPSSAPAPLIKKAYYRMQKICHPDVAGPEGQEMCMLLNDAYDVLSDPKTRTAYDEQLVETGGAIEKATPVTTDLGPTWKWMPKQHGKRPVWKGTPRSRSNWAKVKPEDRGEKHFDQKFLYVDEWQCISCRNCCDVAPHSFCIDIEHNRARVYTQWGNSEEYLDYAVSACPVDCIHWVSREELQSLEHVTADKMYDSKGYLPCPMAMRQGVFEGRSSAEDPFELAAELRERSRKQEAQRKKAMRGLEVAADKFRNRILEAYEQLSRSLRMAGWGA